MYERIIFLEEYDESGAEAMELIDQGDYEGAIRYLAQWHYPGEHETASEPGHGSADSVYEGGDDPDQDGYILSWNWPLGYVSLEYEE
jgi:hypothetical protein